MKRKINIISAFLFSIIIIFFIKIGMIKNIIKTVGLIPSERPLLFGEQLLNYIFTISIIAIIGYLFSEIIFSFVNIIREKNKKIFQSDQIIKFSILIYFCTITMSGTSKYGLRIIGYIILPFAIYHLIKNRKKMAWNISDIFLIGFPFSILLSFQEALYKKSVIREFQDNILIFILPLIIKQLDYGKRFKQLLLNLCLLVFSIKILLGYLEKLNFIIGLYGGHRISGGDQVWRYAGIIMFGVIFLIYQLIFGKNNFKEKIGLAYVTLISMLPMVWSQNRANWVAIIATTFIMILVKNWKRGIIITAILSVIFIFAVNSKNINNQYIQRLRTIAEYKKDTSTNARFELWKESIEMFEKSPITGIGYSPKNFAANEKYLEYKILPKHPHEHSHSTYFYVLGTMGIVGMFFLIGFSTSLIVELFKMKTYMAKTAMFIFISWAVMGFFETPIKYRDMLGIIMVMIGCAFGFKGNINNKNEKISKF